MRYGEAISRIGDLERELHQMRQALAPPVDALPSGSFIALELSVGEEGYLVPASAVREVIPLVTTQAVPDSPPWMLGNIRYRGQTVPTVDLHRRLGCDVSELSVEMVIIVTKEPHTTGFVATSVGSLRTIEPAHVTAPSAGSVQSSLLHGSVWSDGSLVHLLSVRQLASEVVGASASDER
ncbi:MAG: chemotaxis protein CheW [Myxococcota bacterium]